MADEDIAHLTQALQHNRSVRWLDLEGNICGEAGYRSILKMVVDISSIKATLESNTGLCEIDLPGDHDEYYSDSDGYGSEYNARDEFQEIRNLIHRMMSSNKLQRSPRQRVMQTQLDIRTRRQLCEMQGVDYIYGSLFAEIPQYVLPELFSTMGTDPAVMDPLRAIVATVASWTSLVDGRLMVETALERNRALVRQLNERNAELEEKLKVIASSGGNDRLSGSKRPFGQLM